MYSSTSGLAVSTDTVISRLGAVVRAASGLITGGWRKNWSATVFFMSCFEARKLIGKRKPEMGDE